MSHPVRRPAWIIALGAAVAALVLALSLAPAADANGGKKVRVLTGATGLTLDPATAGALTGLGVSVAPYGSAFEINSGLAFPILPSRVTKDLEGSIRHGGGLSLTAGSTEVVLKRFVINLDDRPDLTAIVGGQRVSILDLDLSQAKIAKRRWVLNVKGVVAKLTAGAATALNQAFGTDALTEGLVLGRADVAAYVL